MACIASSRREIARFLGRRSAMVFPTGYQANLGMLAGLAGPRDVILLDADSHSSIYDGCRLSGATLIRFRHNDPEDLDRRLGRLQDQGECKLIVVEGIYSMLGDRAPLAEFAEVKRRHGAYLLVDEAHSLGVLGANGRGAAEEQGIEADVDCVVGTFSKSLGAVGGFGASDHPKFDTLRFCSRPYMFTASSSPSSVASVLAAFGQIRAAARSCAGASGTTRRRSTTASAPRASRSARQGQPDRRGPPARRAQRGAGLEPAARARHLRQSGAAARHAERDVPAALQRLRGPHARADRRGLPAFPDGRGRARGRARRRLDARRARLSRVQRKPPAR